MLSKSIFNSILYSIIVYQSLKFKVKSILYKHHELLIHKYLIFSIPLLFRWSGRAVCSSPVAQGLQHRLCRLRERRDSRRGGPTSGGGRLKQSQNITLFCQIVWHHRSSQHHVYCCNYFSIFCILFFAFYIGKITLF